MNNKQLMKATASNMTACPTVKAKKKKRETINNEHTIAKRTIVSPKNYKKWCVHI